MKKFLKKILPEKLLLTYRNYKKRKNMRVISGDKVQCSICNSHFKYFAPYGVVSRPNARCHNCGSLERHRLLWKYLDENTQLFNPTGKIKVLHFAPERIFYDKLSSTPNIIYTPCDLMPELYEVEGGVEVVKADITKIPFDDQSFDVILCNHVLEHIIDDKLAMKELFRVLKPDGFGVFMVPMNNKAMTYEDFSITDPKEREKAFGQYDHVRVYGKDYFTRLQSCGFTIDEKAKHFTENFSDSELHRFGFLKDEILTLCTK